MITTAALIYGVAFVLIGILGYVPGVTTPDGMLLGIFHVNSAHNLVHIPSGIFALIAYSYGARASQAYFRVFGWLYGLVAVIGFFVQHGNILGFIANNPADNWLHVLIAVTALYVGYGLKETEGERDRDIPLREAYRQY